MPTASCTVTTTHGDVLLEIDEDKLASVADGSVLYTTVRVMMTKVAETQPDDTPVEIPPDEPMSDVSDGD